MKTNRKKLLEKLETAIPGIQKGVVEFQGSDYFFFTETHVCSFSGNVAVHVELEESLGFTGALPAKKLYDILRKITSESVDIVEKKASKINLSYRNEVGKIGKIQMTLLPTTAAFDYLCSAFEEENTWMGIPANFIDVLKKTYINNNVRWDGVLFSGDKCFCCNGAIMSRGDFKTKGLELHCWLNGSAYKVLSNYKSAYKLSVHDGWLRIQNADSILSIRSLDSEEMEPKFLKMFAGCNGAKEEEVSVYTAVSEVHGVIDRLLIFAKQQGGYLHPTISIEGGTMELSLQGRSSSFSESIILKNKGIPTGFSIDALQFKDALKLNNKFCITKSGLLLVDDDDCIRFINVDLEDIGE